MATKINTMEEPIYQITQGENPENYVKDNLLFMNCVLCGINEQEIPNEKEYLDFLQKGKYDRTVNRMLNTLITLQKTKLDTKMKRKLTGIIRYLFDNSEVVSLVPKVYGYNINVEQAIRETLTNPAFDFNDPENRFNACWSALSAKVQNIEQVVDYENVK